MPHFARTDSVTRRRGNLLLYDGPWQRTRVRAYACNWEGRPELRVVSVDEDGEDGGPVDMSLLALSLVMRRYPEHVSEPCVRNPTRVLRILRWIHRCEYDEGNAVAWSGRSPVAVLSDLCGRRADERNGWNSLCAVTFREAPSEARRVAR